MNPFLSSDPEGLAHPLQGWLKAVTTGADHAGFNAALLVGDDPQKLLLVWRSGLAHFAWPGAELKLMTSYDEGATFEGLRSIYLSKDWDTRNFAGGRFGRGRVGLVASRFRGLGANLEMAPPVFVFSDDGGATWTVREFAAPEPGQVVSFHGDIVRWPASAGGHDTEGFAAFSYNTPHKLVDGLYTRDNGETWFWRTDICRSDGVVAEWINEPAVAPVGPDGPWLMICRPTIVGAGNAAVWSSRDLVHWDGPRDGGVKLAGNPPALIVEDGVAHLYTVARRGAGRELPTAAGDQLGNRLLVASAPAEDLVDGELGFGSFGGWREVAALPNGAVGYIFPRKIRRRWFAAFNCAETGAVGSTGAKRSVLGLMTPHPPLLVDVGLLRSAEALDSRIDNGDFSIWERGERFETVRSGQATADRWLVRHPDGDDVAVEKATERHPLGGPSTWLRKRSAAPGGAGPHQTVQRIAEVGLGAGGWFTLTFRAMAPAGGRIAAIRLRQSFGATGPAAVESTLARDVVLTDAPLLYAFPAALPEIVVRPPPPDSALEIVFEERAAGDSEPYDLIIGDVSLALAPAATSIRPAAPGTAHAACERYFRRVIVWGLASADGAVLLSAATSRMARPPILRLVSLDGGDAASPFAGAGCEVLDLGPDGAQLLARGVTPGGPVRAVLEFDAEWAPLGTITPEPKAAGARHVAASGEGGRLWLPEEAHAALGRAAPPAP